MLLLKLIFTFLKLRIATICTSSLNKNFWLLLLTYPCFVEKLRKQYIFIYIHDTSNSYKIFKKRDTDKSYTFLEPRMIGLTNKIKFDKVIFEATFLQKFRKKLSIFTPNPELQTAIKSLKRIFLKSLKIIYMNYKEPNHSLTLPLCFVN